MVLKSAFLAVASVGLIAGSAMATATTWTDTIDWDPDIYVSLLENNPFNYFHDISDDGFESYWMDNTTGDDQIFRYDLSVDIYDDNVGTSYSSIFGTVTLPDFDETASIWTAGGVATYDFDFTSNDIPTGFGGSIDLYHDGTLNVSIISLGGDFFLGESSLIAYGDNGNPAPVPEPATMLLFGTGLAGLAGFSRKKSIKA